MYVHRVKPLYLDSISGPTSLYNFTFAIRKSPHLRYVLWPQCGEFLLYNAATPKWDT